MDHHTCISSKALQEILGKFEQTNFSMEKTFWEWSKIVPQHVPDAANRQQDGTKEHLKIEKLEQQIKDMSIQKEQLVGKLGFLQEQHRQELYDRNQIEHELCAKIKNMNNDFTHQKESLRGTLNQLQQIRLTILSLKEQTQNHMQGLKPK